jgi:hypothetical protein
MLETKWGLDALSMSLSWFSSLLNSLFKRLGDENERLMHLVPAPAERLMKSRVLSRPGANMSVSFSFCFFVLLAPLDNPQLFFHVFLAGAGWRFEEPPHVTRQGKLLDRPSSLTAPRRTGDRDPVPAIRPAIPLLPLVATSLRHPKAGLVDPAGTCCRTPSSTPPFGRPFDVWKILRLDFIPSGWSSYYNTKYARRIIE